MNGKRNTAIVTLVAATTLTVFAGCKKTNFTAEKPNPLNSGELEAPRRPGGGQGGGPESEHVGSSDKSTFDDGAKPPPAGPAAAMLPGEDPNAPPPSSPYALDANGGTTAGVHGTRGIGEGTLITGDR